MKPRTLYWDPCGGRRSAGRRAGGMLSLRIVLWIIFKTNKDQYEK